MALPTHYIKRRDLLHHPKTSPQTLAATGNEYFQQESYSTALDFFEKAHDEEGLRKIKQVAMQNGDSFLLARLERFDAKLVTQADWEKAAAAAEKRGSLSMAACARKKIAPVPEAAVPGETPIEEAAAKDT